MRGAFTLIALVLGFALGMASLLNFFKFEYTVRKLQSERIQTVAKEVDQAIQKNLAYSSALDGSGPLAQLVSQSLQADPLILSADIFGPEGQILFTSDARRSSLSLPKSWQAMAERSHRVDWLVQDSDAFVAGRSVTNSFGVKVATVALRYRRDDYDETVSKVLMDMALAGVATFGVCLLVALFALMGWMKLSRKVRA